MVGTYGGKYVMCGRQPIETHHMLTRARGGLLLDKAGETAHLMWLCHGHHMMAHDCSPEVVRLLIDGYVVSCSVCGVPEYYGPDEFLSRKYGRSAHGHQAGESAEQPVPHR
jgi:hypothetical protein